MASEPGKAIKRYASGKFLPLALEAVPTAGSRHGNQRVVVPIQPSFQLLGFQRSDWRGRLLVDADDLTFDAAECERVRMRSPLIFVILAVLLPRCVCPPDSAPTFPSSDRKVWGQAAYRLSPPEGCGESLGMGGRPMGTCVSNKGRTLRCFSPRPF